MATSPKSQNDSPAAAVIDKRGDVILKLVNKQTTADLLVSSRMLSSASPVFQAMINMGFAESQGLSPTPPKEISLPDDDPEPMTLPCKIVHFQTSDIPDKVDFIPLADFAFICDKYDCIDAVRFYAKTWTSQLVLSPDAPNFEKLLFVTYVLGLPKEFKQITRILLPNRKEFVKAEVTCHGCDFLPPIVLKRLQKDRQSYHAQASIAFQRDLTRNMLKCAGYHERKSKSIESYLHGVLDVAAKIPQPASIKTYREKAHLFKLKDLILIIRPAVWLDP